MENTQAGTSSGTPPPFPPTTTIPYVSECIFPLLHLRLSHLSSQAVGITGVGPFGAPPQGPLIAGQARPGVGRCLYPGYAWSFSPSPLLCPPHCPFPPLGGASAPPHLL